MIGLYVVVCLIVISFASLGGSVRLYPAGKEEMSSIYTVEITMESATAVCKNVLYSKFAARQWSVGKIGGRNYCIESE
jgi:hypothetical protein